MIVSPYSKVFDRANFSCGVAALDDYLKLQVGQDLRRDLASCFVLHRPGEHDVLGYYTLSAASVATSRLDESIRYAAIPVFLIGRLAVDENFRRSEKGMGALLLEDGFRRALSLCEMVAAHAIVVDAKDERARNFYERNGLRRFPDDEFQLFTTMKELRNRFRAG